MASNRQTGPRPFEWYRFQNYRIDGGRLIGEGEGAWYLPETMAELPDDFIGVRNEEKLRQFANRYGLLGYGELTRSPAPNDPGEPDEITIVDDVIVRRVPPGTPGEKVEWILAHSRTVLAVRHTAFLLAEFWRTGDKAVFSKMKEIWQQGPFAIRDRTQFSPSRMLRGGRELVGTELWSAMQNEEHARSQLEIYINENIRGVHPLLNLEPRDPRGSGFEFSALIELIYWRTGEDIRHGKIRVCRECETVFRAKDSREIHCSRTCATRYAMRRYRSRPKTKSKPTTKPGSRRKS